jgi:hypothetical protein
LIAACTLCTFIRLSLPEHFAQTSLPVARRNAGFGELLLLGLLGGENSMAFVRLRLLKFP